MSKKNGEFLNPYRFVSTPARESSGPLADLSAQGETAEGIARHDVYSTETYSGELPITITAQTPMLLQYPKAPENGEDIDINDVMINRDHNGAPQILATSVRGVLRSAYEAITNSRYGVLDGKTLSMPMGEREILDEVVKLDYFIAKVVSNENDEVTVRYIYKTGKNQPGNEKPADLPRIKVSDLEQIKEKDPNKFERLYRNGAWFCKPKKGGKPIDIAKGMLLGDFGRNAAIKKFYSAFGEEGLRPGEFGKEFDVFEGRILMSGRLRLASEVLIEDSDEKGEGKPKQSERIYREHLPTNQHHKEFKLSSDQVKMWRATIDSYQRAATDRETQDVKGYAQHIDRPSVRNLEPGTVLWLRRHFEDDAPTDWIPVPSKVGRTVFESKPMDLVAEEHRAADTFGKLSPADRVFGWVKGKSPEDGSVAPERLGIDEDDRVAFRGKLAVSDVHCTGAANDAELISRFKNPLSLGILATPKMQQWRFYTTNGYDASEHKPSKLRGRKFYQPHHLVGSGSSNPSSAVEYWKPSTQAAKIWQEVEDQNGEMTKQVHEWVNPGATFTARVSFTNLSAVELGALVWLLSGASKTDHVKAKNLSQPDGHVFMLGAGKPFGFGSVQLKADFSVNPKLEARAGWCRTGEEMAVKYSSLSGDANSTNANSADGRISGFMHLVDCCNEYLSVINQSKNPDLASCLKDFLAIQDDKAATAVHYPGAGQESDAVFQWWREFKNKYPHVDAAAWNSFGDQFPRLKTTYPRKK